ncbi:MAG: LEPR-XLL domain-containing protein, partial [Verrucomicrobia bacterium]|nr:LEPR-XLL domain-containing protein [Verrucomicrobiota bacterium]
MRGNAVKNQYQLEALEPRVLLSGQPILVAPITAASASEVIVASAQNPISTETPVGAAAQTNSLFDGVELQPLASDSTSAPDAVPTGAEVSPEAASAPVGATGTVPGSGVAAQNPPSQPGRATDSGSVPGQLTETLHVANAPPTSTASDAGLTITPGQLIFLNFDGAFGVTYHGPATVYGINEEGFSATANLAGKESLIIGAVLAALEQSFAGRSVVFTITQPKAGTDYSTIYIGGDGSAFTQYGMFYGLSEKQDVGNQDHTDIAFVFSSNLPITADTAADYAKGLAGYVEHEAGHLIGLAHAHTVHTDDVSDIFADVAWKPYSHVEIARDVRTDILDNGKLTIAGHEYDVNPKILAAVRDYEAFYFAGAVGPDGFPDLVMGQGVIHPTDTGTWLTRVLDMAWAAQSDSSFTAVEKSQILAWSYGFLTHAAGDLWAHTLVNEFSEGVFPDVTDILASLNSDQRDFANFVRHFLVEAYMGDATTGFDGNGDALARTPAPGGDLSDDSTPGIQLDAPTRFIYETLIRPFPEDPTHIADTLTVAITVDAGSKTFTWSDGSFLEKGFAVGQKITATGFAANNNTFHVAAISANGKTLTVVESLAAGDATSTGDEQLFTAVPKTGKLVLGVNVAANTFTRSSGSFVTDGFVVGQRFAAFGFNSNDGDYRVVEVTATSLKVDRTLVTESAGSGDEQLVAQGNRGKAINAFFSLSNTLQDLAAGLPGVAPADFGALSGTMLDRIVTGTASTPEELASFAKGYLLNWAADINDGLRYWSDMGLALSKALFDPQSRRDLQNEIGVKYGADTFDNTVRAQKEHGVGVLDVFLKELDDPNNDGEINESFVNNHLLPMLGLPRELGFLREVLSSLGNAIDAALAPLDIVLNPIRAGVAEIKEVAKNFIKKQIEDRFGFSYTVFDFLTNTAA